MFDYLESNLTEVKKRIEEAKEKAGRQDEVLLLGVTKTFPAEVIRQGKALGIDAVGENKAQELVEKYEALGDIVNWHFIGHLQKNKVKYIIDKVVLIHSVESLSLAKEISKRALGIDKVQEVLLEVNVSGEESKFGLKPEEVVPFLEEIKEFAGVKVKGLMTMAPYSEDEAMVRGVFKGLRELKDQVASLSIKGVDMDYLSMGMSHDFMWAIEEGATIVRVGSLLYGKRDYQK